MVYKIHNHANNNKNLYPNLKCGAVSNKKEFDFAEDHPKSRANLHSIITDIQGKTKPASLLCRNNDIIFSSNQHPFHQLKILETSGWCGQEYLRVDVCEKIKTLKIYPVISNESKSDIVLSRIEQGKCEQNQSPLSSFWILTGGFRKENFYYEKFFLTTCDQKVYLLLTVVFQGVFYV